MDRQYFLALLLPEDRSDQIKEWMRMWDPKFERRPPPHVTIWYNSVPKIKVKPIINQLTELCQDYQPFNLTSLGTGMFKNDRQVLYLDIAYNSDLVKFQQEVTELLGIARLQPFHQFHPHVTITKLPTAQKEKLKIVEKNLTHESKFDFVASQVALFESRNSDPWKKVWEYQL